MKKSFVALFCLMSSSAQANFLVQNNTDIDFNVSALVYDPDLSKRCPVFVQVGNVSARAAKTLYLGSSWKFIPADWESSKKTRIDFFSDQDPMFRVSLKNEEYFELLKNAKTYLPTFEINRDATGKISITGPMDEKELKEVIEKLKQQHLKATTKEISEATNFPKGVAGIAGEYCLETQ